MVALENPEIAAETANLEIERRDTLEVAVRVGDLGRTRERYHLVLGRLDLPLVIKLEGRDAAPLGLLREQHHLVAFGRNLASRLGDTQTLGTLSLHLLLQLG